jgi:hypothetical protein
LFDPARTQLFSFETRGSVVGEEAHGRAVATQPRPTVVCLATLNSPLAAITASGLLLLATPLLLPRRADVPDAADGAPVA